MPNLPHCSCGISVAGTHFSISKVGADRVKNAVKTGERVVTVTAQDGIQYYRRISFIVEHIEYIEE